MPTFIESIFLEGLPRETCPYWVLLALVAVVPVLVIVVVFLVVPELVAKTALSVRSIHWYGVSMTGD